MDDQPKHLQAIISYIKKTLLVEIVAFTESKSAIQAIHNNRYHFDAFVLDIEMAGQRYTGIDVAERIRSVPEYTVKPIIFLSSYAHFSFGALRYIHYYDFFYKNCDAEKLTASLRTVLFASETKGSIKEYIVIKMRRFTFEIDTENISYIELHKKNLTVVDLLGREEVFRVKPNTFTDICNQLTRLNAKQLQQIHRTVIINLKRIQSIEWHKNTATVRLFNVKDWVPAGKTYLKKLDIYKE